MHPEKVKQLGINPSTAAHRLRVDLLFKFAVQLGHKCHHCGGELNRDTFSIEHNEPWLHTPDPMAAFFDLDNIGFSHLGCNSRNKRHPTKMHFTEEEKRAAKARWAAKSRAKTYSPEKRAEKYQQRGT